MFLKSYKNKKKIAIYIDEIVRILLFDENGIRYEIGEKSMTQEKLEGELNSTGLSEKSAFLVALELMKFENIIVKDFKNIKLSQGIVSIEFQHINYFKKIQNELYVKIHYCPTKNLKRAG